MIYVKDLTKGQVVWECESWFGNLRLEILEYAKRIETDCENGWVAMAKADDGKEVRLFQHHEITHYGPFLYTCPMYVDVTAQPTTEEGD